jgi:hypothetical protein
MTSARLSCRVVTLMTCGLLVAQGAACAAAVTPAATRLPTSPALQATLSSALGRDQAAFALAPPARQHDVYTATLRGGAAVSIHKAGFLVSTAGHRWGLTLSAMGRGANPRPLAVTSGNLVAANRVDYALAGGAAWFVNGPAGLEQGWTIAARPPGGGDLRLLLAQTGDDLSASLAPDRRSLLLRAGAAGRQVLRYGGLAAYDAAGRELGAELEIERAGIAIRVRDAQAAYPIAIDPILQLAKLTASDGIQNDELGNAVAVSADGSTVAAAAWGATIAGKANQGALYVFERLAGGWSNATEVAKLTASDGAAQDTLGYSVAVSSDGTTVVAGAIFATEVANHNGPGAAYVFVRPGGGWRNATETARLIASDRREAANFGISVAMSGDGSTVAVGAQQAVIDGTKLGAVYVFVRSGSVWKSATETAKLQGSDEGSTDLLGHCVGLSRDGSTIVAGADGATVAGSASLGAVYVFLMPGSGWTSGTETAKLTLGAAAAPVDFAFAVAVSGDGGTVAASANSFTDQPGPGAVYLFSRPGGGWSNSTPAAKLTASDGAQGDSLGESVAISADGAMVLAGASAAAVAGGRGAAYEFVKPAGGWASETEAVKLAGADGGLFGGSVALSDDGSTLVGGALGVTVAGHLNQGAAYVFAAERCQGSDSTLCLDDQPGDQRWQISATYAAGKSGGAGHAIGLSSLGVSRGGLFWFFDSTNPEILLKVLNGCAVDQHFWVFSSATTNVGFTLTVTDTRDGRSKVYSNQDGTAAPPIQDTGAFACTAGDAGPGPASSAGAAEALRQPPPAERTAWAVPVPMAVPATGPSGCSSTATSLCIAGRFQIVVQYQTAQGGGAAGSGQAVGLQSLGVARGGLFWFFAADNPEMLVKVLDACSLNEKFWIFYAAGTNVGFTLTVTDAQTGQARTYHNPDATSAPPVQDTSALPCA